MRDVVTIGAEMRAAQNRYFKQRKTSDLIAAKLLEKEFDETIASATVELVPERFIANARIAADSIAERAGDLLAALGFDFSWDVTPGDFGANLFAIPDAANLLAIAASRVGVWAEGCGLPEPGVGDGMPDVINPAFSEMAPVPGDKLFGVKAPDVSPCEFCGADVETVPDGTAPVCNSPECQAKLTGDGSPEAPKTGLCIWHRCDECGQRYAPLEMVDNLGTCPNCHGRKFTRQTADVPQVEGGEV